MAQIEAELHELGYQILAVSPDRPSEAEATFVKLEQPGYTVLSDSDMSIAQAFGLAYRMSDANVEKYREYGIDLEKSSGEDHHLLPVPAAYVVTGGVVRFAYVNPDHRIRVDADVLLAAAKAAMKD